MIYRYFGIKERLLAYILPRKPETEDQIAALEQAAEAQEAFEIASGVADLPGNVAAVSNDGVSVTFAQGNAVPSYTKDTISPVAWSILRNAGLIVYTLPTARKP